jgi:hypothetical protein
VTLSPYFKEPARERPAFITLPRLDGIAAQFIRFFAINKGLTLQPIAGQTEANKGNEGWKLKTSLRQD